MGEANALVRCFGMTPTMDCNCSTTPGSLHRGNVHKLDIFTMKEIVVVVL